jgi:putative methyltransferase
MEHRDWAAWHGAYDDPASPLSRRLRAVQGRIRGALAELPSGPVRALSLCAGQGRDLLGVLYDHPRRDEVTARLVELDPVNTAVAERAARRAGLTGIEVVTGDASRTDAYAGAVPADLVLICGVFGNITDTDIERTIALLPQLCATGAFVVWTRNRQPPDITGQLCRWFDKYGFENVWLSPPEERGYGVGSHRYTGEPVPLERGVRLFTFIGYDTLRNGAPWPG